MVKRTRVVLSVVTLALLAACDNRGSTPVGDERTSETEPSTSALPPVVNGWREHSLRDGVISIKAARWRADTVDVPVPVGKGLEYTVMMTAGDTLVYNISFGALADSGAMLSEFHGHTEQINGVGDLMFYSRTGGSPQSGAFTAPWDGIHGWYLKNDSTADVVVRLELAGFYEPAVQ